MRPLIRCWNAFLAAVNYAWEYSNGEPNAILYGAVLLLIAPLSPQIPRAIGLVLIVGGARSFWTMTLRKSKQ